MHAPCKAAGVVRHIVCLNLPHTAWSTAFSSLQSPVQVAQVKLAAGQSEADACEAVRGALEAAGVTVRSVALEHDPIQDAGRLRTAYVRLPPPPLPWAQWAQNNGGNGGGGGNDSAQVRLLAAALLWPVIVSHSYCASLMQPWVKQEKHACRQDTHAHSKRHAGQSSVSVLVASRSPSHLFEGRSC